MELTIAARCGRRSSAARCGPRTEGELMNDPNPAELGMWNTILRGAWPAMWAAVWEKLQQGAPLVEIVGSIHEDPDGGPLRIGALFRFDAARLIAKHFLTGGPDDVAALWLRQLGEGAPPGHVYVLAAIDLPSGLRRGLTLCRIDVAPNEEGEEAHG
jgi:hypothetical protein